MAGLLVGLASAAAVLGADLVSGALVQGSGHHPLEIAELKTYDWRLTQTARPDTARKDIALIEIDEYSLRNLQPYAGRWPWPRVVHAMLID
jgi:CHASE2 domain-containing sensor protein